MPRQSRIDAPGTLHHLIIRGIERKAIFKDDADRYGFIERIESIFSETNPPCFAWALMSNHVHLLTRTAETPLTTIMRRLLTGYAVAFNRRHHRHGHLFQNRYKSILCQEERVKGDERILGDTDFVRNVLKRCNENYLRKYRLAAQGVEFNTLAKGVAAYFNLTFDQLNTPGRYPAVVQARSVLCFLAVRQLGLTATELARKIGLTQPAISISVKRGEGIVKERRFDIADFLS